MPDLDRSCFLRSLSPTDFVVVVVVVADVADVAAVVAVVQTRRHFGDCDIDSVL